MLAMSPEDIDAWIDANVQSVADVRVLLKRLTMLVLHLHRATRQ